MVKQIRPAAATQATILSHNRSALLLGYTWVRHVVGPIGLIVPFPPPIKRVAIVTPKSPSGRQVPCVFGAAQGLPTTRYSPQVWSQ